MVFFYNTSSPDTALTVEPLAPIVFGTQGQHFGMSYDSTTGTITVNNAGAYSIFFYVLSSTPNQFDVTINFFPLIPPTPPANLATLYGINVIPGDPTPGPVPVSYTGFTILVLSVGDRINVVNYSEVVVALSNSQGGPNANINASVLIQLMD